MKPPQLRQNIQQVKSSFGCAKKNGKNLSKSVDKERRGVVLYLSAKR